MVHAYPWYFDPLPLFIDPPTQGISTTYPWHFDPPYGISTPTYGMSTAYPWYFDSHTHGIKTHLPMVFWPPYPWYIFTPKNHSFYNYAGRREKFWGISCEKSRFHAKKSYVFQLPREARKFLGYFVWKKCYPWK
jgi:hypothetical protein